MQKRESVSKKRSAEPTKPTTPRPPRLNAKRWSGRRSPPHETAFDVAYPKTVGHVVRTANMTATSSDSPSNNARSWRTSGGCAVGHRSHGSRVSRSIRTWRPHLGGPTFRPYRHQGDLQPATHFVATRATGGKRYTGTSGRPSSTSMA
jgi:hypothetical protein